jgi:hypothetical protein
MVRPRRMIRNGHPACRLKPASSAVPAASAKEENKKNNDDKRLGIHDVKPFQDEVADATVKCLYLLPFRVWRSCRAANPANWPRPV